RSRRRRWIIGLGVPLLVAAAILVLAVFTQITLTFEGRLWTLPARVYARVDPPPSQPGQYRRRASGVDLFVRGFAGGESPVAARRVAIAFDGDSIASIRDERGRPSASVDVEPELLSLVFGRQQEERMIVPLAEIPKNLIHAVLAAEDVRFYKHSGIDPFAVLRAAFTNVKSGRIVQGGSTITQQTVKNLYFGQE